MILLRAYMIILNMDNLGLGITDMDRWTGMVSVVVNLHWTLEYRQNKVARMHKLVLAYQTGSRQSLLWKHMLQMLKHPRLAIAWSNVLLTPAYRRGLRLESVEIAAGYDPSVSKQHVKPFKKEPRCLCVITQFLTLALEDLASYAHEVAKGRMTLLTHIPKRLWSNCKLLDTQASHSVYS